MSIETNKATVRRYYDEVKNRGNLALLDELVTPNYLEHNPIPGQGQGLEGLRRRAETMAAIFRSEITVEDVIASGDRVVVRFTNLVRHQGTFMGLPATGKSATVQGIAIHRLQDSRIAERWILVDNFSLLMQLGAFRQPTTPGN